MKISDILKRNKGSVHSSHKNSDSNKPLVLVIDDEEMVHIALEQHLTAMGYATAYAFNSEQAYDILKDQVPALILLDIFIPGNNTMDLMSDLKQRPELKQTSVVVISGTKNVNAIASYLRAGASDYILKPFHGELLKARLRNNMSQCSAVNLEHNRKHEALQQENASLNQQLAELREELAQSRRSKHNTVRPLEELKASYKTNKQLNQQIEQLREELDQLQQHKQHSNTPPKELQILLSEAHKKLQHTIETNRMMNEKLEHDLNNVVLGVSTAAHMLTDQ